MIWNKLETEDGLNDLIEQSFTRHQLIFKHSTRCSISSVAKNRLDKKESSNIVFHYVDVIAHRNISNLISEKFTVYHESPQVLLIKNGECIYDESHSSIYFEDIATAIAE